METNFNPGTKDVSEYYDKLWADLEDQNINRINSRHRIILHKLKKLGLAPDSSLLEVGCGNGLLTSFLAGYVTQGPITAADISPASIEYAKKKYKALSNIQFVVSDLSDFTANTQFDFIVFPDVLEHIPVEQHRNIFRLIRKVAHDKTTVFINIPNPRAIKWYAKHQPESLQIIDQPLDASVLLADIYANDFYLESFETYSLHHEEPDYQSLVVRPNTDLKAMTPKSKIDLLLRSLKFRF
jgi:trans-aconitate 2-methyltransferase